MNIIERILVENSDEQWVSNRSTNRFMKAKLGERHYFLKEISTPMLYDINEVHDLYRACHISTPDLITSCSLNGKSYILYEWIDGVNLKELVTRDNSLYYEIGKVVGEYSKRFSQCGIQRGDGQLSSIVSEWQDIQAKYMHAQKNNPQRQTVTKIEDTLYKYIDNALGNLRENDVRLIHGDLKPANIVLSNENVFLVDIEGATYDYDAVNYRYCLCTSFFSQVQRKTCLLLSGILNTRYPNGVPADYKEQLQLVLSLEFFYEYEYYLVHQNYSMCNFLKSRYEYALNNNIFSFDYLLSL